MPYQERGPVWGARMYGQEGGGTGVHWSYLQGASRNNESLGTERRFGYMDMRWTKARFLTPLGGTYLLLADQLSNQAA
jgi:hypothetical protein